MSYTYEYPRPSVTVDIALLASVDNKLNVLLIQRGAEPYKGSWALPGGFMDMDEMLDNAALRELKEETGITGVSLSRLDVFDAPGRDPRGRTITLTYVGICASLLEAKGMDDAADAKWYDVDHLPDLAFDHAEMIDRAISWCNTHHSS